MNKKDYQIFINNLSKKTGILGRSKYFNSVILVPFVLIDDQYYLLFQERAAKIRQAGEICFPGGGYDKLLDKSAEETAIRESIEELGISREKIFIDRQIDTLFAPMGVVVDIFVGRIDINDISELKINKQEVENVFLIPLSHFIDNPPEEYKVRLEVQPSFINKDDQYQELLPAKELGLPEKYHSAWEAKLHNIYVYRTKNGIIWGLTAEVVFEIVSLYKHK